jgi:hypothetical protein
VRCDERGIDTGALCPVCPDLRTANAIVVASGGNSLYSDDDPGFFFRVADIVVATAPR